MNTEEVNKVALASEDDKRVIMEDGIHTLAYGHHRLINWGFLVSQSESVSQKIVSLTKSAPLNF